MSTSGIYNYAKLKGRIREKNYTQEDVAKAASISPATLSQKLSGRSLFRQREISAICNVLNISPQEIGTYFFTN